MTLPILVSPQVVTATLTHLRSAGERNSECVVLWLAAAGRGQPRVIQDFVPEQIADEDFFRIPAHAMQQILATLRDTGTFIAAQVHSHPSRAYHSPTDDRWAIIRHVDALSVVVPDFATFVTADTFRSKAAFYRHTSHGTWTRIAAPTLERYLVIR